jgi:hypothetical protein
MVVHLVGRDDENSRDSGQTVQRLQQLTSADHVDVKGPQRLAIAHRGQRLRREVQHNRWSEGTYQILAAVGDDVSAVLIQGNSQVIPERR